MPRAVLRRRQIDRFYRQAKWRRPVHTTLPARQLSNESPRIGHKADLFDYCHRAVRGADSTVHIMQVLEHL